jgi:hypothetical protein
MVLQDKFSVRTYWDTSKGVKVMCEKQHLGWEKQHMSWETEGISVPSFRVRL